MSEPLSKLRVTLDTNALPATALIEAASGRAEFTVTTVTMREAEGTAFVRYIDPTSAIVETGVYGESVWDECVWAEEDDPLEEILALLSNGSFPKGDLRETLSKGQLRQLRDAMVLAAHVREERDVLVSNDRKAYIDQGRREFIERRFKTRIMTSTEFIEYLTLLPPITV